LASSRPLKSQSHSLSDMTVVAPVSRPQLAWSLKGPLQSALSFKVTERLTDQAPMASRALVPIGRPREPAAGRRTSGLPRVTARPPVHSRRALNHQTAPARGRTEAATSSDTTGGASGDAYQQRRHAAYRLEGADVAADPVGEPLRPGRLRVGEARCEPTRPRLSRMQRIASKGPLRQISSLRDHPIPASRADATRADEAQPTDRRPPNDDGRLSGAPTRQRLVAGTLRGLKRGRARQRAEFETGLVQRFLNTSFDLEEIDPKEFAIRTQPGAIEQWSKWALTEADHIDPVKSARFLEGIEPEDREK
jgi:hypothetical protein